MALTKVGKEGITGVSNASDATAITIDSSEKVGIGLTSPQELLHLKDGDIVVGNGTASNSSSIGKIGFSTDSSNSRFIGIESFRGSDAANADLRFHTFGGDGNSGERMKIDNDGIMTVLSEGRAVTTSVQQGLAKQWLNWDGATTIADSFNTTSATDNASGDTTITIANDMASINFAVSALSKSNDNAGVRMATMQFPANQTAIAAGTYRMHCLYTNTDLRDAEMQTASVLGDLA